MYAAGRTVACKGGGRRSQVGRKGSGRRGLEAVRVVAEFECLALSSQTNYTQAGNE